MNTDVTIEDIAEDVLDDLLPMQWTDVNRRTVIAYLQDLVSRAEHAEQWSKLWKAGMRERVEPLHRTTRLFQQRNQARQQLTLAQLGERQAFKTMNKLGRELEAARASAHALAAEYQRAQDNETRLAAENARLRAACEIAERWLRDSDVARHVARELRVALARPDAGEEGES